MAVSEQAPAAPAARTGAGWLGARPVAGTSARIGSRRGLMLFLLAFAIRVTYAAIFARHYIPVSDAGSYYEIAGNVAHGHGVSAVFPYIWRHDTAFRPPLYPIVLGGLFAVTGVHVGVAMVANMLLGSAAVVLIAILATRIAGKHSAGMVAGCLAMVFPPLLFNDVVMLTEPLAIVLLVSTLILLVQSHPLPAGLLTGLLVLTRTSAQLFVLVLLIWVLVRIGWRAALTFAVASVVVVAPWVIRNDVVFGRPVIVTSNGFNLAAIWSDQAQAAGHFVDPVFDPAFASVRHYGKSGAGLYNLNEANLDASLQKVGLSGMRHHPGRIPKQLFDNVRYLADASWQINDSAEKLDGRDLNVRHVTLPLVWLGELAYVAAFVLIRRRPGAGLLILSAAYFFAVALVTVSPPRLRAPTDALGMVGIGVAVMTVPRLQRWFASLGRRLPAGLPTRGGSRGTASDQRMSLTGEHADCQGHLLGARADVRSRRLGWTGVPCERSGNANT